MTSIAITQPTYLPWLGYFQQMARADCFVFLDTVQFAHQSWQSRNRLRDIEGNVFWLTVPVASHRLGDPISDIRIARQPRNWRRKHLNSVRTHLGGTPYLDSAVSILEGAFAQNHELLVDLNIDLIERVRDQLGIQTQVLRASELAVSGSRSDLLLAICQELGASRFLANAGSRIYLQAEEERFEQAGVSIDYQCWKHPEYEQCGDNFIVNLSWLDPVCHLGWSQEGLGTAEDDGAEPELCELMVVGR
ncbi:MAG: WbqC family protein [Wenzhouxiangella sp.]|nr:WbqC family protein [Wenzhouxiangella sp.]